MYMNRFLIGMVVGLGVGAAMVWYLLSTDKDKKCLCKKGKKWAKRVTNIY